jgi:hypothetical protein
MSFIAMDSYQGGRAMRVGRFRYEKTKRASGRQGYLQIMCMVSSLGTLTVMLAPWDIF